MPDETDSAELIEWDVPEWDMGSLLLAAEVGAAWAFFVLLEEGSPDRTALTAGVAETLGRQPEELQDFTRWKLFLDEAEHARLEKFFTSLPPSRRAFDIELRVSSAQGGHLWMKVFARRQEDRVVGVFRDVTLERMAEDGLTRQYQLISAIFSTAPVPIVLCDENLRVIECNPHGAAFLEVNNPAEAFGLDLVSVFTEEGKEKLKAAAARVGAVTQFLRLDKISAVKKAAAEIEVSFTEVVHDVEKKYFLFMVGSESVQAEKAGLPRRLIGVEDNPQSRLLLEKALEKLGREIIFYSSAEECLAQWDPESGGMVFIDLGLPGINGVDLAKELRQRQTSSSGPTRLILMTAYNKAVVDGADIQNLFDDYLEKPVDLAAVRKIIGPTGL